MFPYVLLLIVAFYIMFWYFGSPKVKSVVAGGVREELPELDIPKRLGVFERFSYNGKSLNVRNYFVGKVDGYSMEVKGLYNNDIFLASRDFSKDSINTGDIFVIKTPEINVDGTKSQNPGRLKLREIIGFQNDHLLTQSYTSDGEKKPTGVHAYDSLEVVVFVSNHG